MLLTLHTWSEADDSVRRELLARPALADGGTLRIAVGEIIERVRKDGDTPLLQLTRELDQANLEQLRVTPEERHEAAASLDTGAARD